MLFEPQYKAFRELTTKVTSMITLIDDVYDKLGSSLEELELLTHLIDRFGSLLLMFSLTFFFHRLQCVTSEWLIYLLIGRSMSLKYSDGTFLELVNSPPR